MHEPEKKSKIVSPSFVPICKIVLINSTGLGKSNIPLPNISLISFVPLLEIYSLLIHTVFAVCVSFLLF